MFTLAKKKKVYTILNLSVKLTPTEEITEKIHMSVEELQFFWQPLIKLCFCNKVNVTTK